MKRITKLLTISLGALALGVTLASCEVSFDTLYDDSTTIVPGGSSKNDGGTSTDYETLKEELDKLMESDYTKLYGYQQLALDTVNGEYLTNAYKNMFNDAYDVLVSDDDYATTTSDGVTYFIIATYNFSSNSEIELLASAMMTMIEENPLFYFTYTGYFYGSSTFYFIGGGEYAKASARHEYNSDIIEFVEEFNDAYTDASPENEEAEALLIHDFICNRIDYAYTSNGQASSEFYAHNIIGVVEEIGAVCESYAETFTFLANQIGLESLVVVGYVYNGNSNQGGHAWNYVNIDGVWYGLDATWDDDTTISYDYFLVGSAVMSKSTNNHVANDNTSYGLDYQVALPTLSSTSLDTAKDASTSSSTTRPTMPSPWDIIKRWPF